MTSLSTEFAPDALTMENLEVSYRVGDRDRRVLQGVCLRIARGEAYGLVGESGSGKSTAAFAAVRYLPRNGRVTGGRILVDGRDLMALSPAELRTLRTRSVSMVYQDPGSALNPTLRIGRQMTEVFEAAEGLVGKAAEERAAQMLARVQISRPGRVMASYPHEISGGMQQRVVIAMALSTNPTLLVLDEPTTGLDATVQAEVLDLITRLRAELATSILFISHSLPVIARMCDKVGVLYAGELIEQGPARELFASPRHPYTVGLLRCAPQLGRRKQDGRLTTIPGFPPAPGTVIEGCVFANRCTLATDRCHRQAPPTVDLGGRSTRCHYPDLAAKMLDAETDESQVGTPHVDDLQPGGPQAGGSLVEARVAAADSDHDSGRYRDRPVLSVRGISKTYRVDGKVLRAVHDVTLDLWPGETLGLVGESGSGKSSLAKLLLGVTSPDSGSTIELDGAALPARATRRSRAQLEALQIVFQNPGSALNRSHSVRRLIGRALAMAGFRGAERETRLRDLARSVRLDDRHLTEKPQELSGGLKQRVAIARAFAGAPKIVVCDEPTSALDVSVQAAILNLLVELQAEQRVSYLFISHDLGVVQYLSDRIAVLYLGRLLEIGPTDAVFAGPRHPYTEVLLSAKIPTTNTSTATTAPTGCVFHTRCPRKIGPICAQQEPPLLEAGNRHAIRCHLPIEALRGNPTSPVG